MQEPTFAIKLFCDTIEKEKIVFKQVTLPKYLQKILDELKKEPHAQIFLNKVNKKDAPNYYEIVKNPMDLGTMEKKLMVYGNLLDFKADLDLIWNNCLQYNTAEYFINCAKKMRKVADVLLFNINNNVYPKCPEIIIINGKMGSINHKEILKKYIVKYILISGIKRANKEVINIIADILEYKICQKIKEYKEKKKIY